MLFAPYDYISYFCPIGEADCIYLKSVDKVHCITDKLHNEKIKIIYLGSLSCTSIDISHTTFSNTKRLRENDSCCAKICIYLNFERSVMICFNNWQSHALLHLCIHLYNPLKNQTLPYINSFDRNFASPTQVVFHWTLRPTLHLTSKVAFFNPT